jgi:indole-3-glycerol phosphate synthase/phosphoribosylanthranilate isomerase
MNSGMDIRLKILEKRKELIGIKGFAQGTPIPTFRHVPVVHFPKEPALICEIKRSSPSKGDISTISDSTAQAGSYIMGGANVISVLTETSFFKGSLIDLINIKTKYPQTAVLRKDFLYSIEDIEISYRAGADIVLLIASILEEKEIFQMYKRTKELGMEALVEVHDKEDIKKVESFKPQLVGINSRDLRTFTIDLILPLKIKQDIHWNPVLIFESGIRQAEDVFFALSSGFAGILVGESVVRNISLVSELKGAMGMGVKDNFWEKLYSNQKTGPYIKICGLTHYDDVLMADDLGADILGFILAESPRQADISFIKNLPPTKALKSGVVVLKTPGEKLPLPVEELLSCGKLDVIQFHGDEAPEECADTAYPYYKAVRLKSLENINNMDSYRSPRVLIDAWSSSGYGGTGKQIDRGLIEIVQEKHKLWLAGGINPENVREIISNLSPELIDVSSHLEKSPGRKDPSRMSAFFKEVL